MSTYTFKNLSIHYDYAKFALKHSESTLVRKVFANQTACRSLSHIVILVNCILELPFLQTLKTVQVSGAPLIIWSEICVGKSLWGIGGGDTIWLYCVATVHTSWKLNIMKIYAIVKSQEHHFIYSHKYNMA